MNKILTICLLLLVIIIARCQTDRESYLYKSYIGKYDEVGARCGYINSHGDTIIPFGKYYYCFTDTLKTIAIVQTYSNEYIGITSKDNYLFTILSYDNGPDYPSEGLFRIIEKDKIGYANLDGEIIIKPQFQCAYPFENGRAKVSYKCQSSVNGEHEKWESDEWIYINKKGKKINAL